MLYSEVDFLDRFAAAAQSGFQGAAYRDPGCDGWIGCEYRPKPETVDGLDWTEPYLRPA